MDILDFEYNPVVEKIVDNLVTKTQNFNREFFRLQTNFYLSVAVSSLGVTINSPITGKIPVNFYGINLSNSGSGKGFSTNFLEHTLLANFRETFMTDVFPAHSEVALEQLSIKRSSMSGCSSEEALEVLQKEFKSYGAYKFTFDSATTPAIKQFRQKLILADIGAINFIMDEIGANLKSNLDPLYTFLELYDLGLVKDKLIKSTSESVRFQELVGSTPANMLLFGTPSKLLDGAAIESEFFDLLEMGYARRCFFAYSKKSETQYEGDPAKLYDTICASASSVDIANIAANLDYLADTQLVNTELITSKKIGIKLLEYKTHCEELARKLPEHQEILKSELSHRYFKVLKLAGTYAFIDHKKEIEETHLMQAIRFAEDSGEALIAIMNREKPYEKLAKYISANKNIQYTQIDLMEELPYYKGSAQQKNDLMSLAIAWGYINNIVIKKTISDGIEFFSGESIKETNLNAIRVSFSEEFGDNYQNTEMDWESDDFERLLTASGFNWVNHWSSNGKRLKESMLEGFNCIVLDVDHDVPLDFAIKMLADYEYIIQTTKRHQIPDPQTGKVDDRFRIILPTNFELDLSENDFATFMKNFAKGFFFELDSATFQRNRKWACYEHAQIFRNKGKLIDVLPFIPKTSREVEYNKMHQSLISLNNVEKWFASRMEEGGRNNQFIRFAYMLAEEGCSYSDIQDTILNFNKKLPNPLPETELQNTVLKSIKNKYNLI